MSSAISIDTEPGLKTRPTPVHQEPDGGFRIWHFFVLLSLLAATVAVFMTRQGRPEILILVSATIGAVGAAAIAVYRMLAPLTATDPELLSEPLNARLRADLDREKALTLRTIKELEFDRAMGKLSSQDFDEMAGRLRARAIGIMKQLEVDRSPYRVVIEKELAARIAAKQPAAAERPRRSLGEGSKVRPAPGSCACGTANDHDARFCKSCGAKLGHGTHGEALVHKESV